MEIKIKARPKKTVYPDIGDNLEQPEEERFAIEFELPSSQVLAEAGLKIEYDDTDIAHMVYDSQGVSRAFIKRLINAPMLDFDNRRRKMQISDIFRYNELTDLTKLVNETAEEMRGEADDSKNS